METAARVSSVPSRKVWDRLWRHRPTDSRDDELLALEERSQRWAAIAQRLEETFGSIEGLRTVELGSGRGDLSVLLARRGAKVTLVDTSEKALEQAGHRFDRLGLSAHYEHADIFEALQTHCGRFDVALSSGVAEHFKGHDRTRFIDAHRDVLRPGGMAVISVPNAWCPPYRLWKSYLEVRGWWPYGMEIPYSKRELLHRARDVGFSRPEARCMGLRQSLGVHWWQRLFGHRPEWADSTSRLDPVLGFTLLLFAWRDSGETAIKPRTAKVRLAKWGLKDISDDPSVARHFLKRGHGVEFEMETAWVSANLPSTAERVLDVGCGIGGLFDAIGPSRALGVDCSQPGLALTRKRFPSTPLTCALAEHLPFAVRTFDAMSSQHVIEHIEDGAQACREWLRVLRPGGLLLLLTPNASFRDPTVYSDETHVRIFDHRGLRELLTQVGFQIMDIRTIGLPWFRDYNDIPSGWRLRRLVTVHARLWSSFPLLRWGGQTLCCVARRPVS